MKTALRARDPVIMLETKALFSSKGPVPEGEHLVPFGLARIARTGDRPHHRERRTARHQVARGRRDPGREGDFRRSHRSADHSAARRRDRGRQRPAHPSPSRRRRGLCHVRGRRRARPGHERTLLRSTWMLPSPGFTRRPLPIPFAPSLERAMLVSTDRIVERGEARSWHGEADPIDRVGRCLPQRPDTRHQCPMTFRAAAPPRGRGACAGHGRRRARSRCPSAT